MGNSIERKKWWKDHRKIYNKGLLISGAVSFLLYVLVVEFYANPKGAEIEISLLTILFQGIGYLVAIGVANLFYNLGGTSEKLINPKQIDSYRNIVFRIGYYLSLLLPLLIPITLLFVY